MIYIASSWKNPKVEAVADCLLQWDIEHYNFKEEGGFHWSMVFPGYEKVELYPDEYLNMMKDPIAIKGFNTDYEAMQKCNACILLLPCNRSAHLEAGWFIGQGKPVAVYLNEFPVVPELMYHLADYITADITALMRWAKLHDKAVL